MKTITQIICFGLLGMLIGFSLPPSVFANETLLQSDKTVAPYFFIEGDDSAGEKFPLKKSEARITINGLIASIVLVQQYENSGNSAINARYIFPGSTRASINGMTMTIGDRRIKAKIKEKRKAAKQFKKAKSEGKTASLLSQKRTNVFSMDVANILPGDKVKIEVRYTELLQANEGIYEFVLPGVVGPRYTGEQVTIPVASDWVSNPYLQKGTTNPVEYFLSVSINSPIPVKNLNSPSHQFTTDWKSESTVNLRLSEDVSANAMNRDFILNYRLQDGNIVSGVTEFSDKGENYFLLVGEPPKHIPHSMMPPREYLFVVDVSGSMYGTPLNTANYLMENLLNTLNAEDSFNILLFAGAANVLSPSPLKATPQNIQHTLNYLTTVEGQGGTHLYAALQQALAMPNKLDTSKSIILITDGYISVERELYQLVSDNLNRSNLFTFGIGSSVNRELVETLSYLGKAEPFVVTRPSEAQAIAKKFQQYISSPVLTGIEVKAEGVELYDLEPKKIPDMMAKRSIVLLGKYKNIQENAKITLSGFTGDGVFEQAHQLNSNNGDSTLPQLWARMKLKRLYLQPGDSVKNQITNLGLKYSLLTRHTSFIAVSDEIRNKGIAAKNVKQPLPLPMGVSNRAVGHKGSEPELFFLLLVAPMLYLLMRTRFHRRQFYVAKKPVRTK